MNELDKEKLIHETEQSMLSVYQRDCPECKHAGCDNCYESGNYYGYTLKQRLLPPLPPLPEAHDE